MKLRKCWSVRGGRTPDLPLRLLLGVGVIHAGKSPLGVGLETSQVWAWAPPPVRAWRSPSGQTPQLPPGCGPGDLQDMLGYYLLPGDLQGMLGYHLQCMMGYLPPTMNRMTDRHV